MTTLFPGALDNFTDPSGTAMLGATTPKHSEHHANINDAIEAIEATIGETGSTDPASVEKRLVDVIDAAAAAAADAIMAQAAAAQVANDLATLDSSLGTAATTDATDYATAAQGAAADAHAAASAPHSGHSTPASLAAAISAHEAAGDPHPGYALESALGTAATLNIGTGALNIVQLDGTGKLPAVDGSQLTGVVGSGGVTGGNAHDHTGGAGAQIAYSTLSGLPTLGSAAAAATGDFEAAGAVSTHNTVTTAHGISAFGATLVDDADAATARTTLVLGNVDNTSDANKPVSTAQQTALNLKANLASPTFTGTVSGITAAMVGAPSGSGTSTGTNTGDSATPAETTTTIGALINGATSKTTPVDADQIGLMDSAASNILKKLSWANIKATLAGAFYAINSKISVDSTSGTPSTANAILSFRNTATNAGLQAGAATDYVWVRAADVLVAAYAQLKLGFGYVGFGAFATPHQVYLDTTTGNFSVGVGSGGSGRLQSMATTEQLRLNYDAANYLSVNVSSSGIPTWTATGGASVFSGDIRLDKTITAGGTTGAQTIHKTIGSVNFAAAATSLVVTNNKVTTSSIIIATVATNDSTMKSVAAIAASGSFTLQANAAATAETRVNFCVFN